MYKVTLVQGYEYHDDYITTGTREITVGGGDVYNMATAERAAINKVFAEDRDDYGEPWVRVEKIERL